MSSGAALLAAAVAIALVIANGAGDEEAVTTTTPAPEWNTQETQAAPQEATGLSGEEMAGIERTLAAIDSGDPLPFDQDGETFQNREGLLPDQPEGYYREYTVETPGSDDRGARRLVIGEEGETYYTSDHYDSFTRIDPEDFR